ncbi:MULTISPECIES: class II glutamine amidotransferase [unclassified Janthinobacterium]|uniref:class II glutamine amidotransferase n=1 Tax=unclassified Janthinobacterium TaxID=2610881 RepID=UPI001618255B|nr:MULTISPECIES: class II glutamine amidotransferase [unclassified Janthinobacterium]MBB5607295.1 glutamine amidotransferase [Janthinobacterium sp. S3T4]MBB5615420.1 glutamine amidotransferase [Janthinobacterium sp. S3M3]
MCQLLAMNSSKPATLDFSFAGFKERGGRTDEHRDGWGIAFHSSSGCTLLTDHLAAIDSPLAAQLHDRSIKAKNIVAHIRKATQGRIAPENTHPFARELWGKTWSFAHNGDLKTWNAPANAYYQAAGDTDSEQAFCYLLASLRTRFPAGEPALGELRTAIAAIAAEIAVHGSFNFIVSDGNVLFAHCSTHLHYVIREYPFSVAHLIDCERSIDFRQHNHLDDRIAVIATHPLTQDEPWTAFGPGELKLFVGGALQEELAESKAAAPPRAVYIQISY